MVDPLKPSAPISGANQAKLDKEKLSKMTESNESDKYKLSREKAGLENPCVFGRWNENYNINSI
jgi:hypothetical protein